jgi:hypothetical protein
MAREGVIDDSKIVEFARDLRGAICQRCGRIAAGALCARLPTVGGALLLSSVMIFAIAVMKSGALSTAWLAGETRGTIEKATWYELAKALICAALAIDAFFGGVHLADRYRLWYQHISWMVILTVAGLMALAAGLFLTRWFAGYLFTRR